MISCLGENTPLAAVFPVAGVLLGWRRLGWGEGVGAMARSAAGVGVGGQAIVIGASMAGLAVAKALADVYERVTVFDRDVVPDGVHGRSGVPQGRHAHVLLPAGGDALEDLFPGLLAETVTDGATLADTGERARFCLNGHRLARGRLGRDTISATRPFLEAHVRRRLRADSAVRLVERCDVRGLVASTDGRRVVGVRAQPRDGGLAEESVAADLVVDCSGARSQLPQWLAELDYPVATVDRQRVDLRYATQKYALAPGVLDDDVAVLVGPTVDGPRSGALLRIEDDQWLVTLAGMGGERPPRHPDRFAAFAAQFPIPDLYDALQQGHPLDDVAEFRYPASVRHRYERLRAFPDGLLAAGDAVCSFNPIYGQGMTVAAMEAVALRRLLATGVVPAARTWFSAIAKIAAVPWDLATVADLAVRCIEGPRTPRTRWLNAYVRRFHAAAVGDPALAMRFQRVFGLLERPECLLYPATMARVLRGNLQRAPASGPAGPGRRLETPTS